MSDYPEFSALFIDGGLGTARKAREAKANAARLRTTTRRLPDESVIATACSDNGNAKAQAAAIREMVRRGLTWPL